MNNIFIFFTLILLFFTSCKESEEFDPRKKYEYNVLLRESSDDSINFDGQVFYAGTTIGLSSCAIIGRRALKERSEEELYAKKWEIICCLKTKEYDCAQEHDYKTYKMPYSTWIKDPKNQIIPKRTKF